jgi:hypothetical protein
VLDSEMQKKVEQNGRPGEALGGGTMGRPPLGRRVFRLHNVASFLLALGGPVLGLPVALGRPQRQAEKALRTVVVVSRLSARPLCQDAAARESKD